MEPSFIIHVFRQISRKKGIVRIGESVGHIMDYRSEYKVIPCGPVSFFLKSAKAAGDVPAGISVVMSVKCFVMYASAEIGERISVRLRAAGEKSGAPGGNAVSDETAPQIFFQKQMILCLHDCFRKPPVILFFPFFFDTVRYLLSDS